jgi:hypothetical protein
LKLYGLNSFSWKIIYRGKSEDDLFQKERFFIGKFGSRVPNGYNLTDGGDGGAIFKGRKHTEQTRARLSELRKGKKRNLSEIQRRKARIRMMGNTCSKGLSPSEETRNKLSKAGKGKQNAKGYRHTEECKAAMKIRMAGNKIRLGRKHSEETKARMSLTRMGHSYNKGCKLSKDHVAKISARMKGNDLFKGRKHSEETKRRMSLVRTGKRQTSETIAKRIASRKRNRGFLEC